MNGAFGYLKWTPDTFWASTLTEYIVAIEGHNEANGGGKKVKAPSDDDLEALMRRYGAS